MKAYRLTGPLVELRIKDPNPKLTPEDPRGVCAQSFISQFFEWCEAQNPPVVEVWSSTTSARFHVGYFSADDARRIEEYLKTQGIVEEA